MGVQARNRQLRQRPRIGLIRRLKSAENVVLKFREASPAAETVVSIGHCAHCLIENRMKVI
jgi:hypothetical protein